MGSVIEFSAAAEGFFDGALLQGVHRLDPDYLRAHHHGFLRRARVDGLQVDPALLLVDSQRYRIFQRGLSLKGRRLPSKIEHDVHLLSAICNGPDLIAYLRERCWPLERERVYLEGLAMGLGYHGFRGADPVIVRHPAALYVFRDAMWGLRSALTDHLLEHPQYRQLCQEAAALAQADSTYFKK